MFNERWQEGQNLSSDSPPLIRLEKDHPEALDTLLCIFYGRYETSLKGSPESCFRLLVIANKYVCTNLANDYISTALRRRILLRRTSWTKGILIPAFEDYLTLSFIIQDCRVFRSFSQGMVYDFKGDYSKVQHLNPHHEITAILGDRLDAESFRNRLIRKMVKLMTSDKLLTSCSRFGTSTPELVPNSLQPCSPPYQLHYLLRRTVLAQLRPYQRVCSSCCRISQRSLQKWSLQRGLPPLDPHYH